MRNIELESWDGHQRQVEDIKRSFEIIYDIDFDVEYEKIPLEMFYPTESFLEEDKLALVFMKVVQERYSIPICALKHERDYFILDGHHRSFISRCSIWGHLDGDLDCTQRQNICASRNRRRCDRLLASPCQRQ